MKTLLFAILALALSLTNGLNANINSKPCMMARYNNAHDVFLKRHLPPGVPTTSDQNVWENFLRRIKTCDRPTQSFFRSSETQRVNAVCSKAGGKVLSKNLCISKEKFSFVTVRLVEGACGIRRISNETKHIIVACDEIGDECLPVHYQGNPKDIGPNNNYQDCGASTGVKLAAQEVFLLTLSLAALWYNL